ncbi:MAG: hypothetical protein R3C49_23665 [Planctomycetaceae bacterium]
MANQCSTLAGAGNLAFATLARSPNLAAVGAATVSAAWLSDLAGRQEIRKPLGIWLVLALLVRLPMNLDLDLIYWLQASRRPWLAEFSTSWQLIMC